MTAKGYVYWDNVSLWLLDTGIATMFVFAILAGITNNPGLLWFASVGFFASILSLVITKYVAEMASHIKRWRKQLFSAWESFPMTRSEREKLREWAGETLTQAAHKALLVFRERDRQAQELETARSTGLHNPSNLKELREQLTKLDEEYRLWCITADIKNQNFLFAWDLFKDMDMLPFERPGVAWDKPDRFMTFVASAQKYRIPAMP